MKNRKLIENSMDLVNHARVLAIQVVYCVNPRKCGTQIAEMSSEIAHSEIK